MENRSSDFHPHNYSDVPLYNIQAVAAATGVPSITLRSWERRYGIPEPKRDPKGYRLYSERDIAVTRWLKDRVKQGIGISRAVNMLRVLERGELAPEPPRTFDFDELRVRLLSAIAQMDEAGVNQIVSEALIVASVEDVALQLLQPALYEVGRLWASGELSVTSEHVGSNLIRMHLAQLVRISPPPLRSERVLVGCAPGEMHDIGALMLALFLRRRGFDVIYAGASVEPDSLIRDVQNLKPSVVGLSAGTVEAARSLATLYGELARSYTGVMGFGGRVFNENPQIIDQIPGVFLGQDSAGAAMEIEARLSSSSIQPAVS